jgi:hypothetical protein
MLPTIHLTPTQTDFTTKSEYFIKLNHDEITGLDNMLFYCLQQSSDNDN